MGKGYQLAIFRRRNLSIKLYKSLWKYKLMQNWDVPLTHQFPIPVKKSPPKPKTQNKTDFKNPKCWWSCEETRTRTANGRMNWKHHWEEPGSVYLDVKRHKHHNPVNTILDVRLRYRLCFTDKVIYTKGYIYICKNKTRRINTKFLMMVFTRRRKCDCSTSTWCIS